jgi:hypothetical protein
MEALAFYFSRDTTKLNPLTYKGKKEVNQTLKESLKYIRGFVLV